VSPSRWAASPLGRLVIAAAIVGLAGGVTACDAGNDAPTLQFHPQSDGLDTVVHGIQIENAFVLGAPNGSLAVGQSAGLFLAMYNMGSGPDQLMGVEAPGVAKSVTLPTGGIKVPVQQAIYLTGPKAKIVLTGLQRPLTAGGTVHVTLAFANAGNVTLDLPVVQRADAYSTFSPVPTPSPSSSAKKSGSATASPTANGSPTTPPTSSPTPSTTP
jgi:copper(I)-binding protein